MNWKRWRIPETATAADYSGGASRQVHRQAKVPAMYRGCLFARGPGIGFCGKVQFRADRRCTTVCRFPRGRRWRRWRVNWKDGVDGASRRQSGDRAAAGSGGDCGSRVCGLGVLWFAMVLVLGGTGVSIPYALKMYPQLFAAKAKPVYWNISCSPVAQVVRKSDGQAMGPTPWTHSKCSRGRGDSSLCCVPRIS